ncbi:hypothetical protein ScalyP_jg2352 [Parmales sp. scaly parma]|nr:hypothetical protein ScalyP_jg2352 [Parmales sp. scaly parma]
MLCITTVCALIATTWISVTTGFTPSSPPTAFTRYVSTSSSLHSTPNDIASAVANQDLGYVPGGANTDFAKRFGKFAGADIPTVSDSMTAFVADLNQPINALYRNFVSDLVATTHLTVVDARFVPDAIWSLGFVTVMDTLLSNYPERDIAESICESMSNIVVKKSITELRSEAKTVSDWAVGKSTSDVESALRGEGSSPVSPIAAAAKDNKYWLYSRFFGIGLIAVMDATSTEVTNETIQKWVEVEMGKGSCPKASADLDQWNGLRGKLTMMETLMKEIEIREKKKMAERLEDKAKAVMAKQEKFGDAEKAFDEAIATEAVVPAAADVVADAVE